MKSVDLPSDYIPSDDEEYMGDRQLAFFRKRLLEWRKQLDEESRQTTENLQTAEWTQADPNDRATVESEAAFELRTRDRYRKLMKKIDSALERINDGSYGFCEETGDEIGIKRLMARPIATLSVEAQERHEILEKQRV